MWTLLLLAIASPPHVRDDTARLPTKTLATCGTSTGKNFVTLDGKGEWHDDGIVGGRLTFTVGNDGGPDVAYSTANDGSISSIADGGRVQFSREIDGNGEFGVVVVYPKSGTAETYRVTRLPDGRREVLWTQNKAHVGPGGRFSSAKVFIAACD